MTSATMHSATPAGPGSSDGTRRRQHGGWSRRPYGSTYVISIVTLTVATILALALLRASGNSLTNAQRFETKVELKNIAEAGIEYGYWYCATRRPALPTTVSNTLGQGQFSVTIEEYAAVPRTIKLTSTAALAGQQLTTTYLLGRPTALPASYSVFNYAICSDQSFVSDRPIKAGTGAGADNDVNVNAQLNWTNSQSKVWGDAYAAFGISSPYPQVTGTKNGSAAMLPFPEVDWSYYLSNCNWYYAGDKDFNSGITFPCDGAIVWVGGDVKFKGPIAGRGIIVAAGDIEFTDNVWYANSASKAAFIAGDRVVLKSGKSHAGFIYAHDQLFSAYVEVPGDSTVTKGAVVADWFDVKAAGVLTVTHDSDIVNDPNLGSILHLPGY